MFFCVILKFKPRHRASWIVFQILIKPFFLRKPYRYLKFTGLLWKYWFLAHHFRDHYFGTRTYYHWFIIHLFNDSLIQQRVKYLLCNKHCSRNWAYRNFLKKDDNVFLWSVHSSRRIQRVNRHVWYICIYIFHRGK